MIANINENGLTKEEVEIRQKKFGVNSLPGRKSKTFLQFFIDQLKGPLIIVLIAVFLISLGFKEYQDAILIFAVIMVNAFMGSSQEYSAEKTLSELNKIVTQNAVVIRDGKKVRVNTTEIVPDDLVVLGSGDKVPADGILLDSVNMKVEEAILTGESRPVDKENEDVVYMGTTVVTGKGVYKVTNTGPNTEIGKIGKSLELIESTKTPLQDQLDSFAKKLTLIVCAICLVIFSIRLLQGEPLWDALQISIILAIAAIPEGLTIAVTVILSLGIKRILNKKGLVKNLLSVETLGSTTVICTDKTGTLTEGNMKVVRTDFTDLNKAQLIMSICNEQRSPLEVALWNFIDKESISEELDFFSKLKPVHDVPFNSENKYTAMAFEENGASHTFLMGAPDIVLEFTNLDISEKDVIKKQINEWSSEGLRLIAFVFKKDGDVKDLTNFEWIGLAGIEDPLRETAKASIEEAINAGTKVKIVTGDYLETALSIANNLGLSINEENSLTSDELEKMSDEELAQKIEGIDLFARVTPLEKLRIVEALQKNGEVVAMTGDGVNDAPALKRADIGIVMGNGTDVAKEAGVLILLDNNFETIVHCIKEGRLIYANIIKVVSYVLSNSFAEIILIMGATVLNLPTPMTIMQILWIHIICDGPLDIALSFEQRHDGELENTPTNTQRTPIFGFHTLATILSVSFSAGLLALYLFSHFNTDPSHTTFASTIAFASLGALDIIYIYSFKDLSRPIWKIKHIFDNKVLNLSFIGSWMFLLLPFFVKPIGNLLEVERLRVINGLEVISVGLIATVIIEVIKGIKQGNAKPRVIR